ncbi:MAG: PAS-domain containing protein [Alphaproteobacteria bacterium]|nr:PAS-domain containing protein [Alphaproteobacteria bacterium]
MNSNIGTSDFQKVLTDVSPFLPLPFAVWKSGYDEVFVSDKLRIMLSVNQNIVDAYSFVKSMQKVFGTFLNTAVEKIELGRTEYSASVALSEAKEYTLNLKFYAEKETYVFTVQETEKNDDTHQKSASKIDASELDKILDFLPVYVWQKNRNLQVTYCNEAYAKALEASKDYVIANNVKLISASRRGVYVDQSLYSTKPKKNTEHVVINGSRRLLSIEETPFTKDGKSTGVAIDITDKEEIETNFRNYQKHTEEVFNNISVPVAIFDANTILVFANQAIIRMFSVAEVDIYKNYKFADIMNYLLTRGSIIASEDILKYKAKAKELFQEVIEPHCTTIHLTNGNVLSVTITPNHSGGLVFVFEDITDKVQLERKVNSVSSIYRKTLDAFSEGAIILESDSKIKIANKVALDLWRREKIEAYIGDFFQNSSQLLTADSKIQLMGTSLLAMISERVAFSKQLQFLSGETIRCEYMPLPDGLGIMRFVNISDTVNLTKTIEEKKVITEQIDRLKSNLISNISHEMHASIQTIAGFADILCNKYFGELSGQQMEYCYGISNAIKNLSDTIDAVIELANMEAGQMKLSYADARLLKIIQTAISLVNDVAKKQNISISTNFEDPEFDVYLDEKSITKALFYLINHSMQELSSGNKINILVTINNDQGDFEIAIKDDGTLLPADELENIQQGLADNSKYNYLEHSLDFGLALANNIVRLHKGALDVQSDEASGNVVICKLPIGCFA